MKTELNTYNAHKTQSTFSVQFVRIFFFIMLLSSENLVGQSFDGFDMQKNSYYDEPHFGASLSYTFMSNPEAPYSEEHRKSGFTMRVFYKKYNLGKGDTRMFWQNKSLGDLLNLLVQQIQTNTGVAREENSVLSDLIGSTSWGWNIIDKDRMSGALGFNLNDYIIGATYFERQNGEPVNGTTGEPQGYYWGTGPSVFFDYVISNHLVLQSFASYSLSMFRLVSVSDAIKDNSYPKPHFAHINLELQTTFMLYGGVDYSWLINRGDLPNQTRRFDVFVGLRF